MLEIEINSTIKNSKKEENSTSTQILPELIDSFNTTSKTNLRNNLIQDSKKTQMDSVKKISSLDRKESLSFDTYENIITTNIVAAIGFAYFGPIFAFCFYLFLNQNFSVKQWIIFSLVLIHFAKRIYEVNYIHIYGREGFRVFSIKYSLYLIYYWAYFGFTIGYFLLGDSYKEYDQTLNLHDIILISMHLICEINNLTTHKILRDLKVVNKGDRGIPKGNMFDYVCNAHYFWEFSGWLIFALFTRSFASLSFVFSCFFGMRALAKQKFENNKRYFKEKYPSNLTAFIPFLI